MLVMPAGGALAQTGEPPNPLAPKFTSGMMFVPVAIALRTVATISAMIAPPVITRLAVSHSFRPSLTRRE